jgi:hypothetical protein
MELFDQTQVSNQHPTFSLPPFNTYKPWQSLGLLPVYEDIDICKFWLGDFVWTFSFIDPVLLKWECKYSARSMKLPEYMHMLPEITSMS